MADDRFPLARSLSITETMFDKVRRRSAAISFSPFQNASSRLTLVLWPPMTIERLATEDFISPPPTSSPSSDYSSDPVSPRAAAGAPRCRPPGERDAAQPETASDQSMLERWRSGAPWRVWRSAVLIIQRPMPGTEGAPGRELDHPPGGPYGAGRWGADRFGRR